VFNGIGWRYKSASGSTDGLAMNATSTPSFDGLAKGYGEYRPGYPDEIMEAVAARARRVEARVAHALDIGAGTGISTRALARVLGETWRITGIEPSADMRAMAASEPHRGAQITYVEGTSEALPCGPGAIGLILVAQALHWFDRPAFYAEAGRILAPDGALAILYNDRDAETPLIQAFESFMEAEVPGYSRDYRSFDYVGEMQALDWQGAVDVREVVWIRPLTLDSFAGLMLSRANTKSYLQRVGEAAARSQVTALARDFADGEAIALGYRTRVAMAVKAA
jgi:SAM-dependent methyltransferase